MKVFIFERVEKASYNYHEEGGLAIVARDEKHAKALINAEPGAEVTEEEWGDVVAYDLKGYVEPRVFVFPDAGCC